MGLVSKAHKGFGLTLALWQWGWGLWCYRARSGITWPHPMEHEVQPHQGDQHQLVEKESGDHGTTPSYKCSNEGIVPGFQTTGISRRLEVHDRRSRACPAPRLSAVTAAPLVKTASAVICTSTPTPAPSLAPWLSAARDERSTSKRPPRMRTVPPPLPLASRRAFCDS